AIIGAKAIVSRYIANASKFQVSKGFRLTPGIHSQPVCPYTSLCELLTEYPIGDTFLLRLSSKRNYLWFPFRFWHIYKVPSKGSSCSVMHSIPVFGLRKLINV